MIYAYEYLFYRLYLFQSRKNWPSEGAAVLVVSYLMTLLFFGNFLLLCEVVHLLTTGGKGKVPAFSKVEIFSTILVLGYCHYLFWRHNRRYRKVVERFESESAEGSTIRKLMVRLYITLSILLPFGAAIIRGWLLGTL